VCSVAALERELARFAPAYQQTLRERMFARLGLERGAFEADLEFLQALFDWLTQSQAGWDQFFHDWFGASAERAAASPQAALYGADAFAPVRAGLEARGSAAAAARLS